MLFNALLWLIYFNSPEISINSHSLCAVEGCTPIKDGIKMGNHGINMINGNSHQFLLFNKLHPGNSLNRVYMYNENLLAFGCILP